MQGIYKITNNINNKIYIGSSKNITHRWDQHISELYSHIHSNNRLQADYNLYGINAFTFEILEVVLDFNKLLNKEQKYILKYKSYNPKIGYNIVVNTKINNKKVKLEKVKKIDIDEDQLYNKFNDKNLKETIKKNLKIITVRDVINKGDIAKIFNNKYALTKSWLNEEDNINLTKSLLVNYIINIKKLKSNQLYWCTFTDKQKMLQNKGYIKSYIPMNCNIDLKRNNLIFAANPYFNTFTRAAIKNKINNDKFAINVVLTWIIGVADINKEIEIFILSSRVSDLLKDWLNS